MALRRRSTGYTCPAGCWSEKGSCYCGDAAPFASRISSSGSFAGLGMIPDFQFYTSPYSPEGYIYTDKLKFTTDVPNQLTVQPVGPYLQSGDANLQGLGVTMVQPLDGVFDSFWWTNRKWIAIGAVSALGLGLAALAAKVLR